MAAQVIGQVTVKYPHWWDGVSLTASSAPGHLKQQDPPPLVAAFIAVVNRPIRVELLFCRGWPGLVLLDPVYYLFVFMPISAFLFTRIKAAANSSKHIIQCLLMFNKYYTYL